MRSISSLVEAPAARANVAAVWRRSWKRSPVRSARLSAGSQKRRRKFDRRGCRRQSGRSCEKFLYIFKPRRSGRKRPTLARYPREVLWRHTPRGELCDASKNST
jgi:hypothetical protein